MSSSKEYRDMVTDCLRWAVETSREPYRTMLFDLAKTCHRKAVRLEHSLTLIDDNVTLQPRVKGPADN
jgi:hypothetical protein